ncbi:hypothetical protein QWY85_13360 [Neolewinella lacunae]|uniref:Uncharacterized protein n=1 Tax=Neolewinella lacunae TaxID=1517758 RepID=A0A923PMU5_9BACT|nr:hypothetical protein [Neolewinella lacunae]MBC6995616.1 hypothetical protein [Neolewinella lacunae]MDN3635652.1 hypothetical protein [Neolewinella lacunae]
MRNNKLILLVFGTFLICTLSCTEPDSDWYTCNIKNEATSEVKIRLFLRANIPPYDSLIIRPGETKAFGKYFSPAPAIYGCEARKIEFIFSNGLGYICTRPELGPNTSELCFLNGKDPFLPPRLPEGELGSITTITQEDFENAYDL